MTNVKGKWALITGANRGVGYRIAKFMAENGLEVKSINPMKKAMLWSSIKMKTMINNSKNKDTATY